jgi:hypothetical protein
MPTLSPEFVAARDAFAAWYDSKDADTQELIDAISDRTYFIIEEQDYDRFINMLDEDYGITSAMDFEDKFEAELEGYGDSQIADWCEQMLDDCDYLRTIPDFIRNNIDFTGVWEGYLRFDYSEVQFQENTYLFRVV